ncbi:Glu/Leu/Phe/Val dehydrogenase [Fusobacteria bacterium ZRK30]|uniref:Glu/Leu/Phe/Val family dehydrogenase n=1 Tax=Psychrilyobacter atlanticus TaxID=271091 RepID=UPI00041C93C6|nr:Glu/Leu/Phe/Val dehydrogenase dimerization domain-containing protein [Psychrilyobacter atlanticus]UUV18143.1 Glu/Leu/Phe/Val dehydrogenase [Fusobacteria bacterium ZRK30]
MKKFDYMEKFGHEQLVFFHDKATGLKGITGIHDTTLGPALGGTRLWNYATEEEAIEDVLRLSRGMTYKAACAGLNLGGGKTVLIGDPKTVKSEAYFRGLGRFVQSLNGRYITAEDVNTSTKDMLFLSMETDHVVGLPGKSGNPSPVTAWGTFAGLKATLKEAFGSDSVADKTFAVQGAGQTGYFLIKYLLGYDFLTDTYTKEKAKKIYFTEINEEHIARMKAEHPEVEFVAPSDIYGLDVDLFAPCALGGVINDETIPQFKCKAIAGSSNNVLKEDSHADVLREKGIVYAPDYVINAAGLINVYYEIKGYNRVNALNDSELIYDRLLDIYKIANEQNISTHAAASQYAEHRMETMKNINRTYIKR